MEMKWVMIIEFERMITDHLKVKSFFVCFEQIFSIALTTLFASQSDAKALPNSSPYVTHYVVSVPTSSKLISYAGAVNPASYSSNSGFAGYSNAAVVGGGFGNAGLNSGGKFVTEEFNNGGGKHIVGGWVSNSGYNSHSTTSFQNQGFYNGRALLIILEDCKC